ncbi:hypothetical protein Taro_004867 [Colocasia esculenta]|uniref:Uncharacterized protein n=1 Tax=Colocasia esculenta TaxID=4460 RepID=A0A843TRF9_COLES|nr:hypothetical protein [Colocasia esculenta]
MDLPVAFRTRQPNPSHSSSECAVSSGVHVVCVCVASSTMPTVVTSPVGSLKFCVSQARECTGLVPVLVYHRGLCHLPEHPHSCVELYVWLREGWQWDNDF